jgi:hypothetical protein
LNFSLDDEWVQDVGEEGAINREIEVALKEFLPRNDAGIFYITQRGKGIEALADVLEYWVTKHPESTILGLFTVAIFRPFSLHFQFSFFIHFSKMNFRMSPKNCSPG